MKIEIALTEMSSDPGYVPSSGATWAEMVPSPDAVKCASDSAALFALTGRAVRLDDLADVQIKSFKRGACNYTQRVGVYDLRRGFTIVQKSRFDISTNDQVEYNAWVVEPESLKKLYERRAKEYAELAARL